MKRNDITALQSKSIAELHKQLQELQLLLAKARLAKAARRPQLGVPSQISDDIARVKVTLTEKKLAEAAAQASQAASSEKVETK